MSHDCSITQRLLRSQKAMFRLAEHEHDISQKIIHLETGMSLSAIGQYARGETAMSGPAILKLANWSDFPSELLSILLDGSNRHIEDGEENCETAVDDTADAADDLARETRRGRHPKSPAGTDLAPCELERINRARMRLVSKIRAAA